MVCPFWYVVTSSHLNFFFSIKKKLKKKFINALLTQVTFWVEIESWTTEIYVYKTTNNSWSYFLHMFGTSFVLLLGCLALQLLILHHFFYMTMIILEKKKILNSNKGLALLPRWYLLGKCSGHNIFIFD